MDRSKIKKSIGFKYENVIKDIFVKEYSGSVGGGGMKLQEFNLLYWDDPNELMDRLRLKLASELHRPSRKNYDRRRVNVYRKDDLWQADHVEMTPYAKSNRGYKYILCVIDYFTKNRCGSVESRG